MRALAIALGLLLGYMLLRHRDRFLLVAVGSDAGPDDSSGKRHLLFPDNMYYSRVPRQEPLPELTRFERPTGRYEIRRPL